VGQGRARQASRAALLLGASSKGADAIVVFAGVWLCRVVRNVMRMGHFGSQIRD